MTFKNIFFTVDSGVARIVLNRPEKLNSLDAETMVELHEAMSRIEADRQVRVLILGGRDAPSARGRISQIPPCRRLMASCRTSVIWWSGISSRW